LAVLLLGLLIAVTVCGCRDRQLASEDARELLRAVRQAKHQVSLKGELDTNVRVGGQYVSGHATVHRGDDRMDLTFTEGKAKGVKIIEQEGDVWQMAPDGKAVRRLPHSPLDPMQPFGKHAVVELTKGPTIAGRRTDKITIRPRPECKARIEMWADADNRFPLASDTYNHAGELVASTRYTAIDFSAPAPKLQQIPATKLPERVWQRAEKTDDATAAKVLGRAPIRPGYVPPGFVAQGEYVHKRPSGDSIELRYSDDVRLLHIMQKKLPHGAQPDQVTPQQKQARQEFWQNLSEEEREAIRSQKWAQIPPQRREAIKRQWQQRQAKPDPDEQRDKRDEQQQEARKERQEQLTEEQRQALKERRQQSERRPGGSAPSAGRLSKEQQEARKQRREKLSEEQRQALKERGPQREAGPGAGAGSGDKPPPGVARPDRQQHQGEWSRDIMRSRLRGKVTRFRVGDIGVVVTGDASAEELRKVADSMKESKSDF